MYLTPTDKHWACDIETDGLLDTVSKIWCVTVCNVVTKEEKEFTDAKSFNQWFQEGPDRLFVGHNFISYDAVVLNRLWKCGISITRIVDTLVLSQLYNP